MIHTPPMPLEYACNHVAHHIGLSPFEVMAYTAEDPHGGYHAQYDDGFPVGSMWRVEGQFLYALVRALKPKFALELGTARGCSATHILQAMHDNSTPYLLDCVDNNIQAGPLADYVPSLLRPGMTLHETTIEFAIEIALQEGYRYDLILDDGMHDAEQVALVWGAADRLLKPGGVIMSHDACHHLVGHEVQAGIAIAGYASRVTNVLIEPADCGFAVWRKGLS